LKNYNIEYDLPYTILRYGSIYGKDADSNNRIIKMVDSAFKQKVIKYSKGASRNFIHVQEAVETTIETMSDKFLNKKVNISGRQRFNTFQLASFMKEMLPFKIELVALPETNDHYNLTAHKYLEHNELVYTLNNNKIIGIEEGLRECIENHSNF